MQAMLKPFPFDHLSAELALEVIRYASTPLFPESLNTPSESQCHVRRAKNPYNTALALCLVSRAVRRATMPLLLHTVILTSPTQVRAFTHFTQCHQPPTRILSSPLHLHLPPTKRMWLGGCPLSPGDTWADHGALASTLARVEELGVDADSLHLLYGPLALQVIVAEGEGLGDLEADRSIKPKRVTFAGEAWRWKPLTSTLEGGAFLAGIERLALCFSAPGLHAAPCAASLASSVSKEREEVWGGEGPEWMREVPLEMMPRLRTLELVSTSANTRGMAPVRHVRVGLDARESVVLVPVDMCVGLGDVSNVSRRNNDWERTWITRLDD